MVFPYFERCFQLGYRNLYVKKSLSFAGFLYDHGHLSRAMCCRVDRDDPKVDSQLPKGYVLNHPWLGRITACEPSRETQKTKALSVNWCFYDDRPEVTDGTEGRCYTG